MNIMVFSPVTLIPVIWWAGGLSFGLGMYMTLGPQEQTCLQAAKRCRMLIEAYLTAAPTLNR